MNMAQRHALNASLKRLERKLGLLLEAQAFWLRKGPYSTVHDWREAGVVLTKIEKEISDD